MRWKELIIGGLITLFVTVLSGAAVYYITKEPDLNKSERLNFFISEPISFSGDKEHASFITTKIWNDGGLAADKVEFVLNFPFGEIRDYSVEPSSGVTYYAKLNGKNRLTLRFDTLLPSESVVLSILGSVTEKPDASLRSNKTVGKFVNIFEESNQSKEKLKYRIGYTLILILTAYPLLIVIFYKITKKSSFLKKLLHITPSSGGTKSRNNMGFLLLHRKQVAAAEEALNAALNSGEDGCFTLANMALCKAVNNNFDASSSFLSAAQFYAESPHEKAVVLFNEAIVMLLQRDEVSFFKKISEAIALSEETKRYCSYSMFLDEMMKDQRMIKLLA